MAKSRKMYDYESKFPKRFRALMERTHTSQEKLAEICSVTRQAISQWMNGITRPDILYLVKISEYFNVSTDYLLGLTDIKTKDKATKDLCGTLGLSEDTIKMLSSDTTSTIAEFWKKPVKDMCTKLFSDCPEEIITAEEQQKLMDGEFSDWLNGISSTIGTVFDSLTDDFVETHYLSWENANSLIELLDGFFEALGAKAIKVNTQKEQIEQMILPSNAFFTTDNGNAMNVPHYFVNVKDVLIDSYITKIIAKLNDMKESITFFDKRGDNKE